MGMINLGAGLSALGESVAHTAGTMALEQQKQNLEQQRLQLADQLTGTREAAASVRAGDPEKKATAALQLRSAVEQYNSLHDSNINADDLIKNAGGQPSPQANTTPEPSSTDTPQTTQQTPPDTSVASPVQTPGAIKGKTGWYTPEQVGRANLTVDEAKALAIHNPAVFEKVMEAALVPKTLRLGEIAALPNAGGGQTTILSNQKQAVPFTDEDRQKFGLTPDMKGYTDETGKPFIITGGNKEPLVQLADGTYVTRETALGKKGPLSTTKQGQVTDTDDDTVQAHVKQVLDGNETLANVPPAYKNVVVRAISNQPVEKFSPIAKQRETLAASRILQQYVKSPQYELTMNGLPYLQRIDAASKNPSSVSDLDLLDSMIKLNTAGNAVTEQQVKTITDGKSWADSVGVMLNRVKQGGVLSPQQRQEIHSLAGSIYDNYKKGFQPLYDEAVGKLTDADIPQQFWSLPNYSKLSEAALSGTSYGGGNQTGGVTGQKFIEGQTYRDSKTGALATYRNGQFVEHP